MDDTGVFTFDSALPTPRDRMRSSLGDTSPSNPLRWDETYDATLAFYDGNETLATAKMARALASQFARNPTSVAIPGGPTVTWSSRVSTWVDLAKSLEAAAADAAGVVSGVYTARVATRPGMDPDTMSEYRRSPNVYPGDWT